MYKIRLQMFELKAYINCTSHTPSSLASAALPCLLPIHLQLPVEVPYDELAEDENI